MYIRGYQLPEGSRNMMCQLITEVCFDLVSVPQCSHSIVCCLLCNALDIKPPQVLALIPEAA